jgi:hypothetical protein
MLNTIALEFIIDRVYLGIHNYSQLTSTDFDDTNFLSNYSSVLKIILFALIAIEKFSHSLESKHILLQSLTINTEQSKMNILEYYEPWAVSNNCLKRQIGKMKTKYFKKKFVILFFKVFMHNGYLIMYSFLIIVDHPMK